MLYDAVQSALVPGCPTVNVWPTVCRGASRGWIADCSEQVELKPCRFLNRVPCTETRADLGPRGSGAGVGARLATKGLVTRFLTNLISSMSPFQHLLFHLFFFHRKE